MVTLTIWWAGILLESILLYRGYRTKLVSKYPFFYSYVASVLLADTSLYFVRITSQPLYSKLNWIAALVSLILGYGIILEIFKHVLAAYPGADRLARLGGLFIFAVIFCIATGYPLATPEPSLSASTVQLERDFWAVQVVFLIAVLVVIAYYRIPIGTNLKGIIFGYGLCRATTLMALALRTYIGPSFRVVSNLIEPLAYLISLVIWVTTLWFDHPSPICQPGIHLEADYESLVLRTRTLLGTMRAYLTKAARP